MEKLAQDRQLVQQMLSEYGKQKPAYGDIDCLTEKRTAEDAEFTEK
jgi:hypothetical protein